MRVHFRRFFVNVLLMLCVPLLCGKLLCLTVLSSEHRDSASICLFVKAFCYVVPNKTASQTTWRQ